MALCLANSLIVHQDFIPYDQLVRYKWWYRYGYMSSTGHCFDIGAATRQSIQEFETRQRKFAQDHDIPFNQMDSLSDPDLLHQFNVNCSKSGVAGNGALMRLAPVPLFFYRDPVKAVEYSGQSGRITHGDDKAYDACRYYGALIVAALNGKKKEELTSDTFYNDHKQWFGDKILHADIMSIAQGSYKRKGGYEEGIRGKGYVVSALEAALWAFWSDDDSFEKGALNAVNLGDDTDTTAAIYGQLAGAYYGYEQLPKKWSELIYAKSFVICVSNWIAYNGEKWSTNQKVSHVAEPIYPSLTNSNPTKNSSIVLNQKLDLRNDNRSNSIVSAVDNPLVIMERKAIDDSGRIGSLYDGWQDRIVKSSHTNINGKMNQVRQLTKCLVESGGNIKCQNLLRFISFDNELMLSVLSSIVSPTGIASVVEYPYQIDEYTRVLYYSYVIQKESLPDDFTPITKSIQKLTNKNVATHVITEVNWGIDLIVILRLSSNQTNTIDCALNKICQCLTNDTKLLDKVSLDGIVSTYIYSNIPHLTEQKTLFDVCHEIYKFKNNSDFYRPLSYILHPIEAFYSDGNSTCVTFVPLKWKVAQKLEQHLLRLSWINKMGTTMLDDKTSTVLNIHLQDQLNEAQNQLSRLSDQCAIQKEQLKQLILGIRYGKHSQQTIEHQLLTEDKWTSLTYSIDDLKHCLISLESKRDFIIDLEKRGFDYYNATNYDIKQGDDDEAIQKKLVKDNRQRILCSNDTLNENNLQELNELLTQMMKERETNSDLRLVYVDFSYCSRELDEVKTFPSKHYGIKTRRSSTLILSKKDSQDITTQASSNDHIINILLLGKLGVGKSTLINTFENSHKDKSYEDVLSRRAPLHTLVTFFHLIKIGYEEHFVQFGKSDPNEYYDHDGQSVTQHCKSYTFNIDNGQKLCIIDTPGFSNTHDQQQNELIMQRILSCIINLTHLNAICVLLESSDTQLNAYQTCLTQLFHFLGTNAGKNIIFCFTKALDNVNNPEQRNGLLKSMYNFLSTNNIPFTEQNPFFFDNTYFLQSILEHYYTIAFDPRNEKPQKSWLMSKSEWDRLLIYVRNLRPYPIHQGAQIAEHDRLEIKQMVRPMLETMRNLFRNQLLYKAKSSNCTIELDPKPISHHVAICYSCARGCNQHSNFWIMSDSPHEYSNSCHDCSCSTNQHMLIDYRLDYECSNNRINYQLDQLYDYQELLFHPTVHFAHFLMRMDRISNNDPFLSHLNRMIDEERYICETKSPNNLNSALYNQLVKFRQGYQHRISEIKKKHVQSDFVISDLIESVKQIPIIKRQMDVARKIQGTSA